ncbi:MAG: CDP-diacylglycerol--serine O-phosphatidyltransferase [Termitinemataceae bacterium]|nr:MAG: CDP-diacylglycerol--serine O-phosphatidyltransferase [Termitinemataceae bacterium]
MKEQLTLNREKINRELKKGMYVIPSLFTCGNMAFGLMSIFTSIEGDFINAAWFLIGALVCDILDGRIARLTNTTSEFGLHLDSFSDLVSFGAAPALLMYTLILDRMGKLGMAIAVLFVLCASLRLARYNVIALRKGVSKKFNGLPTPASAGIIISFVLSYELVGGENPLNLKTIPILIQTMPYFFKAMPLVMIALSFLMVSNVPYSSFKKMDLSKPRKVSLLALIIVVALLIIVYPQNVIFIIFTLYVLSGIVLYVPKKIIKKNQERNSEDDEEDDDDF